MAEAVVDILTYHNYLVDAVSDGEDALSYALSETYDGIILDIMMPKLSGLEVLQRLRAAGCRTPILLLTAKTEVEDRIQGLDAGADDYLPKPFAMGGAQDAPCRPSTVVTKLPLFQTPAPAKMRCRSLFAVLKKISACDKIARGVPYIRKHPSTIIRKRRPPWQIHRSKSPRRS